MKAYPDTEETSWPYEHSKSPEGNQIYLGLHLGKIEY